MNISFLPTINACLNLSAAIFLVLGWRAIKQNKKNDHKKLMIGALCCSALFLISYISYHIMKEGVVTRYEGEGIWRIIYFTILLTHTPLATIIVPFCIAAVFFALKGNYTSHVKITKWLFPTWMYVSITGVLIYVMLYLF